MDVELPVDGGNVVADRVERQVQLAGDLLIRHPLADEAQNMVLARREVGEFRGRPVAAVGPPERRHLLDDRAAEP